MSLLLDARKKSQLEQSPGGGEAGSSGLEFSLEELPGAGSTADMAAPSTNHNARSAGQNLFNAKSHASPLERTGINRNLLIALGATVLLLAAGAGYVWYAIQPPHLVVAAPPGKSAVAIPPPNNLVPDIASSHTVPPKPGHSTQPKHIGRPVHTARPAIQAPARNDKPVLVERHHDEPIDPLLNNAYLAYRSGKFEHAQQLYHEALKLDMRNMDAILGLAVIAQRRGEDGLAAHYYSQALAIDPRNAVANAGMSALVTDDNRESRLKTLLNEQQDSSSLHFALGNRYAEEARWGEAQQAYFNAYRLEPNNAELAFNLAVSLDKLGQKKSAVQYYQRALQLDQGQNAGIDHTQISQRIEALTH